MSKTSKCKKSKVPKLTEAEYAAYISSLKTGEETTSAVPRSALKEENGETKRLGN